MSVLVDYGALSGLLDQQGLSQYSNEIYAACKASNANRHGGLEGWLAAVNGLPDIKPASVDLTDGVTIQDSEVGPQLKELIKQQLLKLAPWRKGPFDLFGIHIDTEWRSNLKWNRLADNIDLKNKSILDVGCGNGYYMFRMLGSGARCVIGVDPVPVYAMQFKAINKYVRSDRIQLLPVGLESLPRMPVFDTVFSMGVLYHRRSPLDHLTDLKNHLAPGGELVLETLVIKDDSDTVLVPENRYAGMKNVWSIPSVPALESWLDQAGFMHIQVLDCTPTTLDEQRKTDWMRSHSLNQFLNPQDHSLTVEGYPAPVRALVKGSA